MRKIALLSASALMALATFAPTSFAQPASGYYDSQHHWHAYHQAKVAEVKCERARQNASNRGAVEGGIGGAVVGSAVAGHGAKTEGGAIGAVAGVLAGRQLAKKNHRC